MLLFDASEPQMLKPKTNWNAELQRNFVEEGVIPARYFLSTGFSVGRGWDWLESKQLTSKLRTLNPEH